MARVACIRMIILGTLLSSLHIKAYSVQTLPQALRSSARRLAPSEPSSSSFTASSSSSSSSSSSLSAPPSSSSSSSSVPSSPSSGYAEEETLSSAEISEDYDTHPQYSFSYSLKDLSAGDDKQQEEKRDGDSLQGKFTFLGSNGHRTLEYNTKNENGFSSFNSNKGTGTIRQHHSETQPEPIKPVNSNGKSNFQLSKTQQSTAKVSQNEQRLSRPLAFTLAKRFPATVLGQRVQTTFVDHSPTLFSPGPEGAVLAGNSEDDFEALRNTGKTFIERLQHPRTIIEHRPATTYITQLTPGSETLSLLRDTYKLN